jgi:putative endonuclease
LRVKCALAGDPRCPVIPHERSECRDPARGHYADPGGRFVIDDGQIAVAFGMRQYFVYVLASKSRVLYVGVTNSIVRRTFEHKSRAHASFTKRYCITKLVYFEVWTDIRAAITREKVLKRWTRKRKAALIERHNPDWRDLALNWETSFTHVRL